MRRACRRVLLGSGGYTLLEMLAAMALLATAVLVLLGGLGTEQQAQHASAAAEAAARVADGVVQRLRPAQPWAVPEQLRFRADSVGRVDARGAFAVEVERGVRCAGGPLLVDNRAAPPLALGCVGRRPIGTILVRVLHASGRAGRDVDTLTRSVLAGPLGRYSPVCCVDLP